MAVLTQSLHVLSASRRTPADDADWRTGAGKTICPRPIFFRIVIKGG